MKRASHKKNVLLTWVSLWLLSVTVGYFDIQTLLNFKHSEKVLRKFQIRFCSFEKKMRIVRRFSNMCLGGVEGMQSERWCIFGNCRRVKRNHYVFDLLMVIVMCFKKDLLSYGKLKFVRQFELNVLNLVLIWYIISFHCSRGRNFCYFYFEENSCNHFRKLEINYIFLNITVIPKVPVK